MKKWEYFTYVQEKPEWKDGAYQIEPPTNYWNSMGKEGWELVTAFIQNGQTIAYFKREALPIQE